MNLIPNYPDRCASVLELVRERSGLSFPANRLRQAASAIDRGMAREGIDDANRYCERLRVDGRAFDDLAADLTVGETYFFREPAHFEFVRQNVLPELRTEAHKRRLRVWSAGCSSGEEAYSLAIVFAAAGLAEQTHILATDISRAALAKACQAHYREWSLRGEAAEFARPWLRRRGDEYELDEELRRHVDFEYLNLALDHYPSLGNRTWGMDLIFCRNVLIYFHPEMVRHVAQRLFASLVPGGWLVTASSDPPLSEFAPLKVVVTDTGLYYRRLQETASELETATVSSPNGRDPLGETSRASASAEEPPGEIIEPDTRAACDDQHECDSMSVTSHAVKILALANSDSAAAERLCFEALKRYPLAAELHCLQAMLLEHLDRTSESIEAARRAIYLDRSLAVAHFTLAVALQRQGDHAGARRAYRNVQQLCRALPASHPVPLADGESAGRLAEAAEAHLAMLDGPTERM